MRKVYQKYETWLKKLYDLKFGKVLPHECYGTIEDLPIGVWVKVHETGDVSHLLINRKPINNYQKIKLAKIWQDLQDQYLKYFGVGEMMKELIDKEKKLILLIEERVINETNDLTFIDLCEIEINELKKKLSDHKSDFYSTKAKLESVLKFPIDMKTTSVKEYYSHFKTLADGRE